MAMAWCFHSSYDASFWLTLCLLFDLILSDGAGFGTGSNSSHAPAESANSKLSSSSASSASSSIHAGDEDGVELANSGLKDINSPSDTREKVESSETIEKPKLDK